MKFCITLLCCVALVECAPLRDPEVKRAAEIGMSLAKKILSDIPAVHERCVQSAGLTLSAESQNLEYLSSDSNIPAAPVLKSEGLTLEISLNRIVSGLDLHHDLLQELTGLWASSEELKTLTADVRDLSAQVLQMQQLLQIPSSASHSTFPHGLFRRLSSDYKVQVAVHLSLRQLRNFTQDVFRSLRHIAAVS